MSEFKFYLQNALLEFNQEYTITYLPCYYQMICDLLLASFKKISFLYLYKKGL